MKDWTKETITRLLLKNDEAVGRALLAILKRQTFDEQQAHDTKYVNGVGFSAFDANIMTSMAEQWRDKQFLSPKQLTFLRACPGKQKVARICKYAGQLLDIANASQVVEDA